MATTAETEPEDIISHEEVEWWSLEALKEYCSRCGYKATGSKKELVARVYCLYNYGILEHIRTVPNKQDYSQLVNHRFAATDPAALEEWLDEKDGMKHWPPVDAMDIHLFLEKAEGVGLSSDDLNAWKREETFNYFLCGRLREVFYSQITENHQCCCIKAAFASGKRSHEEDEDGAVYSTWVKLMKKSGEIITTYCSCSAESARCAHTLALMFKINTVFRCSLAHPEAMPAETGAEAPINMRLSEMVFTKRAKRKGKGRLKATRPAPTTPGPFRRHLVEKTDPDCYKQFIRELREAVPNAVLFLAGSSLYEDGADDSPSPDTVSNRGSS